MSDLAGPPLASPGTSAAVMKHLELICHAERCEIDGSTANERCPEPRCAGMKRLFHHMRFCGRRELCLVDGCFETRQLVKHYRDRSSEPSPACSTVKSRKAQNARTRNPRPPRDDPVTEQRKLWRQLMEFVLHIYKCQSDRPRALMGDCGLENCEDLQNALEHNANCGTLQDCPYPNCQTTHNVLQHWRVCEGDCSVCYPVRLNVDMSFSARYLMPRDPKMEYFISKQVEQVLHALVCLDRVRAPSHESPVCPRSNCKSLKSLLQHVLECNEEKCPVSQCFPSKRILKHWTICSQPDCRICVSDSSNQRNSEGKPSGLSSSHERRPILSLPRVYPETMTPPVMQRQRWLVILLVFMVHAHRCAVRSKLRGFELELYPCSMGGCMQLLEFYHHVLKCENYGSCTENEACQHTRIVLHHARTCIGSPCEVCLSSADVFKI